MHWRRAALLLIAGLAGAAAQGLVQHADPRVGFQAWMVLQLLGVIAAAIAVAAAFSVIGLAVVRVLTWPARDRPSVFVAWSFLRAQRIAEPLPLRLWRRLRRTVDADPVDPPSLARGWVALGGLGCLVAGLALTGWALGWGENLDDVRLGALMSRNAGGALALHGLLLVFAALPVRALRSALVALLPLGLLAAITVGLSHPQLRPFVSSLALGASALVLVAIFAAVMSLGRRRRIAVAPKIGYALAPVAAVAILAAVSGALGPPPVAVIAWTAGGVLLAGAIYLVLQSQPKVTLPVFVAIVGVAAGTWALIVVLSVMGGFAEDLRAKMLVANAHALVERPGRVGPLLRVAELAQRLRAVPGVAGVSPQVRGDAIVSSAFNVNNFVAVRGIDPNLPEVQRELGHTIVTGALSLLSHPERLGRPTWTVHKNDRDFEDLPPVPAAATGTQGDDPGAAAELDALIQFAPGPAPGARAPAPPPPQDAPPAPPPAGARTRSDNTVLLLPADDPPIVRRAAPAGARPDEGDSEAAGDDPVGDLDEQAIAPALDAAPRPEDPLDSMGSGALRASLRLPGESDLLPDVDVPVAPAILLGTELARSLQVELGDRLEVITPDADVGPSGLRPRVRTFRVAGTFETGLYEADSKVAYVDLGEAARYFNLEGAANVIELRMATPEEPDPVVQGVRAALKLAGAASDVQVLDWRALNRSLFSALAFERLVIFLVLALIILVASFAIVSALTMVILQKRNGIAMLQAMGAGRETVRAAFVQMGAVIGMIGTTAGLILGLGTCLVIQAAGIKLPDAYYVRTLPVSISVVEVGAVVLAALAISLVATVFPAKSAARLSPLEGLRYE